MAALDLRRLATTTPVPAPRAVRALSSEPLILTALYDLHKELGGKMVPFAGYELPVQYEGLGVKTEHMHCRSKGCASLFDVSHMGQIKWYGADRAAFLEKAVVGDAAGLGEGEGRLTLVVKDTGGIVDDAVLANAGDHVYMVVNGARKHKDMAHFSAVKEVNPTPSSHSSRCRATAPRTSSPRSCQTDSTCLRWPS